MEYTVSMDYELERLKREVAYLRNCVSEAYNALGTLPGTSLDNWCVSSPICRAIRPYRESFDEEFEPKVVARKRRKVSQYLTQEIVPGEISGEVRRVPACEIPDVVETPKVGKAALGVMNTMGFDVSF